MQTVQWDYSGKWDTRKKCKNYIEYICTAVDGKVYNNKKLKKIIQENNIHLI